MIATHRCPYRMWLSRLSPSDIGVLTECGYHVYLPQTYVSLPNVAIMFISLRYRCPYLTPMSEGDKHDSHIR
jgi:hypothetical protein